VTKALLILTLLATGDRAALLAADRAYARDGLLAAFADDAAYLHPGAPLILGKTAIRAFLDTALGAHGAVLTWTPVFADVSSDGTRGYTYGWMRLTTRADGATPVVERGKYLACWRKAGRAPWRIIAYVRNAVDSATSLATPPHGWAPAPPHLGSGDRGELLRVDQEFAAASLAQGARAAFLTFAAENAVTLPGGGGVRYGREAIGKSFDGAPAGAVLEWAPVLADVASTGDLGCTVGEAVLTLPRADGAARRSFSKYLTVWKRQRNGEWRFVADAGNARPEP
jgi:ketosteroid isomerase-like protein